MIEGIESKLIPVCLINNYSLNADLHIFVHEPAEFSSISLECTKVKLLIINNFAYISDKLINHKVQQLSAYRQTIRISLLGSGNI